MYPHINTDKMAHFMSNVRYLVNLHGSITLSYLDNFTDFSEFVVNDDKCLVSYSIEIRGFRQ